jgi:ABC-type polar amino acid transport system ATPase subunit
MRWGLPVKSLIESFFDEGVIVEEAAPADFFDNPHHERTKLFISQTLQH